MPGIKAAVFGASASVWSRAISSAAVACRRCELGARPGGGLQGLPLGLLANAVLERPSHPVVDRLRLGQGYESVGFLGTRHRPREQESTDEHGDQHDARLRDDAARQRAFRAADTHCFQRLI